MMQKKNTWLVIGGAILFVVFWWFLGEWDEVEYMSERGQMIVSIVFLVGLIAVSYFMMRGRKQ